MLTSGHPPETIVKVLTYGHSPGFLEHDIEVGDRRLASLDRYSSKWKPWSEQWRTRTAKLREWIGLLEEMNEAMLVRRIGPIEQPTMVDTLGREQMGMLGPTQEMRAKQIFPGAVKIDQSLNSPKMKMKPRCGICVLGPTWMAWVWGTRWTTRSLLYL